MKQLLKVSALLVLILVGSAFCWQDQNDSTSEPTPASSLGSPLSSLSLPSGSQTSSSSTSSSSSSLLSSSTQQSDSQQQQQPSSIISDINTKQSSTSSNHQTTSRASSQPSSPLEVSDQELQATNSSTNSTLDSNLQSPASSARTFDFSSCVGTETGKYGSCKNDVECKKHKGTPDGSCMGGLGVCCVMALSCGEKSVENNTIFANPDFPEPSWEARLCEVEIKKKGKKVMQVMIEFEEFELAPPNHNGECITDVFQIKLSSHRPSPYSHLKICGQNTGQHMYLDVSQVDEPVLLSIATSGGGFPRKWSIRIVQMDEKNYLLAPPGCLQYYTDTVGHFRSFNLGKNLRNLYYAICFRIDNGYSGIRFTENFFGMNGPICRKKDNGKTPYRIPPPLLPQPHFIRSPLHLRLPAPIHVLGHQHHKISTGYEYGGGSTASPSYGSQSSTYTSQPTYVQTNVGYGAQQQTNQGNYGSTAVNAPGNVPRYKRDVSTMTERSLGDVSKNILDNRQDNIPTNNQEQASKQIVDQTKSSQDSTNVGLLPDKQDQTPSLDSDIQLQSQAQNKQQKQPTKQQDSSQQSESHQYSTQESSDTTKENQDNNSNNNQKTGDHAASSSARTFSSFEKEEKKAYKKDKGDGPQDHVFYDAPPPLYPPPPPLPMPPPQYGAYQHQIKNNYGGGYGVGNYGPGKYGGGSGYPLGPVPPPLYPPLYPPPHYYHSGKGHKGDKGEKWEHKHEKHHHHKADKEDKEEKGGWWPSWGSKKDDKGKGHDKKGKNDKFDQHHEALFPIMRMFELPYCEPRFCGLNDVITFPPSGDSHAEMCGNKFNRGHGPKTISGSPLVVYVSNRGSQRGAGFDMNYEQVFYIPNRY